MHNSNQNALKVYPDADILIQIKKLPELYASDMNTMLRVVTKTLAENLHVSRVSIWQFNKNEKNISCLDCYELETKEHSKGEIIDEKSHPKYFSALYKENIIQAEDVQNHDFVEELLQDYFKKHNIIALLDVPFFLEGNLGGVICFEQKHQTRIWRNDEIIFTHCLGSVLSLTYEKMKWKEYDTRLKNFNHQLHNFNRDLLEKKKTIENQQKEIMVQQGEIISQNEELRQQQEELEAQTNQLYHQNQELERLYQLLHLKNHQLEDLNIYLENQVKQRTQELIQSNVELIEQNHQLEQFAFITAHNLRAPVARIVGLVTLLDKSKIGEENDKVINYMISATYELDRVIKDLNQILDVRKGVREQKERVSLKETFERVLYGLRDNIKESYAEIKYDFFEVDIFQCLPVYLESILYNLISNAIKYHHKERNPLIECKSKRVDNSICIIIKDNGLGINLAKHQRKVFGLYQRFHDHVEGKGLGLHLIKSQVEALQGRIELDSQENIGSTFRVFLPL